MAKSLDFTTNHWTAR